jgi:ABC-type bacteriocin/lantibiotic exporter with double-glycine peptidase domain
MHSFPPVVPEFSTPSHASRPSGRRGWSRDFSHPDTRSPSRFLSWLLWQQASTLAIASLVAVLEFAPGAVGPFLVGRIVDRGITQQDMQTVLVLSLALLAMIVVGAASGVLRHTLIVGAWLVAMYGVMQLVTRKTTQMGHVLPRRTPTGEILSVSAGDSDQFGGLTEILTRAFGSLIAYLVVAGIVLRTSVEMGIVVLVAAPLLVLLTSPLLKPLQRREAIERSRSSELTSMATDIVAGLRILRGIGGEATFARNYATQSQKVRRAGVSAGNWQALVEGTGVLLAGLFLVALTWMGARQVAAGELSVGQLISFFGYAVFMVWPIQNFFELVQKWVRGLVSARKTIAVLGQQPPWASPEDRLRLPLGADLHDEESGFTAPAGLLTVVVSALPDDSAALADRLGRYLPTDNDPISLDVDEALKGRAAKVERARQSAARTRQAARDREVAERQWGVRVGPVDLADVEIEDVRHHVLVSDTGSLVFAGTLQSAVDPHGRLTREQAEEALHTAAAEDVFEALPGGWQGVIEERGRGLSGGQRQRVVLARAIASDPEILVLVEPTSAVDAHTEALIAGRLAEARRGRTTVVLSVSPLLLHHADRVALMVGGRIVETGTHDDLLRHSDAYRQVVARNLDQSDT